MPGSPPRKVVIDGVTYVPLSKVAKSVSPNLRRALVEAWTGQVDDPAEIDELAASLRVVVTDSSHSSDPTIDAFVAALQRQHSSGEWS